MVSIINKYLDQIKKNLKKNSIDKDYIDEFTENLCNQLEIQLEELQAQSVDLSLEEAEIQVLTRCEPVEIVVQRVVAELRAHEPRVKIDYFTEVSVLQPFEQVIITIMKQLDKGLYFIGKKIRSLKEWYLRNENPLLTSVFYLFLISCSIIGILILLLILPSIIYATTFPDNKSYIFLHDVPQHIWSNPEITSISVTPLTIIVSNLILLMTVFVLIAHLGWKYSTAYSIKTGGFFCVFIILLWSPTITNYRWLIKNRTADLAWGIMTTPDWVRTQKISVQHYFNFLVNEFVNLLVLGVSTILIFLLLGSILRKLVKERPSLQFKQNILGMSVKIVLIIIFMSTVSIISQENYSYLGARNAPLPSYSEQPVLYRFDIDWSAVSSSRDSSGFYLTSLPQFGGISFYFDELFNVTLLNNHNTDDLYLSTKCSLSPLINNSDEPSSSSQAPFLPFGLLYLPSRIENLNWQELVASHLNSSYPFPGYTPNTSSELKYIDWHANNSEITLKVHTLVFYSLTNNSKFEFSFDTGTGWLIYANLTLDNQSWVSGWDLKTLTITRAFLYNQIQNPDEFYLVDTLLSSSIVIGTVLLLCVAGVHYYKRPRS